MPAGGARAQLDVYGGPAIDLPVSPVSMPPPRPEVPGLQSGMVRIAMHPRALCNRIDCHPVVS